MKVLQINSVCGIRSTGRIVTDLADVLTKAGHKCFIAFGRETVPEKYQEYSIQIGTNLDVKLHGVKARIFDKMGFGSKRVTKRFIYWINKYDPDIIHLHNIHGYYLNIDVLFEYLKKANKPVIWTLHDCWAFTGHSAYCDAIKCEKWKIGCSRCPLKNEYPKSYTDMSFRNWIRKKNVFSGVRNLVIVTPSQWLADRVNQSFLSIYPVKVIHNGIDTSVFNSIQTSFKVDNGINEKMMVLGVASIWNEYKGLHDYYKLADILGENYQVVLVGLSKKQKLSLPSNILGLPSINSTEELAKLYTAADVLVNLSHCENFPTVLIEALSCGTPLVTYDIGGSAEVADKSCETVCTFGDITAIANAICEGTHKKLSKDQQIEIKTKYDRNYVSKQYLHEYEAFYKMDI